MFGWFLAFIWLSGIGKPGISTEWLTLAELLTFDSSSEVGVVVVPQGGRNDQHRIATQEQRRKFWSVQMHGTLLNH